MFRFSTLAHFWFFLITALDLNNYNNFRVVKKISWASIFEICFFYKAVFHICPLNLEEWLAVIKISIPVILLDEKLKFISRTYIDGLYREKLDIKEKSSSANDSFVPCAVMWIAYGLLCFYFPIFHRSSSAVFF